MSGRRVKVRVSGHGYYGRTLGTLYRGAININRSLVEKGLAYNEGGRYEEEEQEARDAKRGVHANPNSVRPKDFRKQEQERQRHQVDTTYRHPLYTPAELMYPPK